MTTKAFLLSRSALERCTNLLELRPPIEEKDSSKIKIIARAIAVTGQASTYNLGILQRIEKEYGIAPPGPDPQKAEIDIIYVKSPLEFPPIVIGWLIDDEPFDYVTIDALAKDFALKMKVPVPKKAYVMGNVVYFEHNKL